MPKRDFTLLFNALAEAENTYREDMTGDNLRSVLAAARALRDAGAGEYMPFAQQDKVQ